MEIDEMYVARNEEIAWSELDDEVVLLDIDQGSYFSLNAVAADLWKLLDGSRTVASLVGEVLTLYDVEESQARQDVIRVVGDMVQKNLAVISPATAEPAP
ncbi:MAG: PqqD family protein [Candidatus Eremiobacteraeota bacterium]|nr:PqqD family protein [Candidatus Eremiobacteraeota bacterium]